MWSKSVTPLSLHALLEIPVAARKGTPQNYSNTSLFPNKTQANSQHDAITNTSPKSDGCYDRQRAINSTILLKKYGVYMYIYFF